jgi:NAD(P)-dependent dehydrogenase (short-subunit alcohol dehydrogenase family)
MKRFVNHVTIVTGAARGIGKECCLRFAREGSNIACLDINGKVNEETAEECRTLGVEAVAITCDVMDWESVSKSIKEVSDRWGKIDTLVASAGIYTGSPLAEVSLQQWQRTIDINLTGVFLVNKAVAPIMMNQKSGSIINISSMAGKTSWPASAEYSASKSGVIGLTRSVAMEVAPYGATANAVCPGNTMTEMFLGVAEKVGDLDGLTQEEWLKNRTQDNPMKRFAETWEIAGVVAFLASEDARYVNGQAIEVDGGMIMA